MQRCLFPQLHSRLFPKLPVSVTGYLTHETGSPVVAEVQPATVLAAGPKWQLEDWLDQQEATGCLPRCQVFAEGNGFCLRGI
jgi:hypothetical protein